MIRKISWLLCVGLIALSAVGWAAQYPLTVVDLSVEGNDEIRRRDILEVVHFKVGDEIEEADLRTASQAIFDLGWFGEVTLDRGALDDGSVVFQVVENPVIQEIIITGNVNRRDYSLFGIKLFDAPIMSSYMIRQTLWSNDVRKRGVLNQQGLTTGLEEVISKYVDRGYPLISVGDVDLSETLRIEFIEPLFSGNVIDGLATVPTSIAEDMIDIPLHEPLQMIDFQTSASNLNQSVYFANVGVEPQPGLEDGSFRLRWTLEERTLLTNVETIESIEIEGNTVYTDDMLENLLGDLTGQPIGNFELLALVQGVYDQYVRSGYIMVELSVSAIEDGLLVLEIAEGEISQVTVQGNTKTHDYVIARNSELEPEVVLNRKDLLASYQQLMSLGYFGSVDITYEWVNGGVEVTIDVTEKSDLGGFGGSMAIDPSTGELFGELTLHEKNVFGTGQDLELSYSRGLVGTEDSSPSTWNLGYSTVAYFSEFDRVGLDLYQETTETVVDEIPTVNITLGAEVSFSYPLADYSSLGLSFRHEEEHSTDDEIWSPVDVVNMALAYDDTNDPFFPTEGNRRRLSLEKAGGFSVGLEYTKLDLSWIHFMPTTLSLSADIDQALAIRIKAGWGDTRLPTSRQTELGGTTSIRGVTGVVTRQYVFANVEYRLQPTEGFYVTTFWDAGFDLGAIRIEDFLSSAGLELGINAAGIIVRLHCAWVLDENFSGVPVFDFGFGQMF